MKKKTPTKAKKAAAKNGKKKGKGKRKAKPELLVAHIEVLQNGCTLISKQVPIRRKGRLALTTKGSGPFVLPHYPLRDGRLEFAEFTPAGICLDVDQSWEGFCTTSGEMVNLARGERGRHFISLKRGDYASITESDLRIMIKVAPPSAATDDRNPRTDPAYRLSFLHHFLPTTTDRRVALIAMLMTIVILGGACVGLLGRPFERPTQLSEVSDEYILPFIDPEHLRQAPETLQDQLDRRYMVQSVMNYYENFTAALMGWRVPNESMLYPTTIKMYRRLHAEANSVINAKTERQNEVDGLQLMKSGVGLVTIPSVLGESLTGSMLRVVDKIDIMQQSQREELAAKRAIQKLFPHDPEYAWEEYKNVRVSDERSKALSEIKVFDQKTDEDFMYLEAESLAARAQRKREKIFRRSQPEDYLNPQTARPISIPEGVRFASFAHKLDFMLADEKLYQLQGSEYGAAKPVKHREQEPLVGEIEPSLIERYIKENRFQLQLCYELALRRDEQAAGTMEWRWRIDSRGSISDIALVTSSIRDQRMTECIRRKISAWRFPRPRRGSVEISYPFEFAPAKG